jgi:hypothetical protein
MHRWGWPNAPTPAPGRGILTTCPCLWTLAVDLQHLKSPMRVSDDRTHPPLPNAVPPRLFVCPSAATTPQLDTSVLYCYHELGQLHRAPRAHKTWPNTTNHRRPGAQHLVTMTVQRLVAVQSCPSMPPSFPIDRMHQLRVLSSRELSLVNVFQGKTTPLLHQLLHPCSYVPTTKCITMCTCVSIFFTTIFTSVSTPLDPKCICNELEHLVVLW